MREWECVGWLIYEVNHENPVPMLKKLHEDLFGDYKQSFELVKDHCAAASEVYYESKTTVLGGI